MGIGGPGDAWTSREQSMPAKELLYGDAARDKIRRGVDALAG
jgi:hypothetical protein